MQSINIITPKASKPRKSSRWKRPTASGHVALKENRRFDYLSEPRLTAAQKAAGAAKNREPSICRSRGGVVIHSANLRSTAFIEDEREADRFIDKWNGSDLAGKHRLADSACA